MGIVVSTNESFKNDIASGLTVVDFFADWCRPCQQLGPILEAVATDTDKAKIVKVNVDDLADIASEFGVMSIPTLILFKDGEKIDQKVGLLSKEDLLTWIEAN